MPGDRSAASPSTTSYPASRRGIGQCVPVVFDERHRLHAPSAELEDSRFQAPFEHPGRADVIRDRLAHDPRFELVASTDHGRAPIEAVHDPGLVDFLERAWAAYQVEIGPTRDIFPDVFWRSPLTDRMGADVAEPTPAFARGLPIGIELGYWGYETTTPLTEGTYVAARSAVDVACTAADLVSSGVDVAYGLCRPPGHHAPRAAYGGYCFFNNAAVAAQQLVDGGCKVAILDVDYHHGNGTQQIFYDRGDVMFVSLHGDPDRAYPYLTGRADETGTGMGRGATLNLPLVVGADDDLVASALASALDRVSAFGPDVIVVSLGLDMYVDDPISDLEVTTDGFERMGRLVAQADRPLVVLQEGGYASGDLGENVAAFVGGAADGRPARSATTGP